MQTPDPAGGFERVLARAPSCALDADGRRSQGERYRTLAGSVIGVQREPPFVSIQFGESLDRTVLEDVIATERECCPWLVFEFDPGSRRLAVATTDPEMGPALDAIEASFALRASRSDSGASR